MVTRWQRGELVATLALVAVVAANLAYAECNRLSCWEVLQYKATSGTNGLYWNGSWQGYNLYTPAVTGTNVVDAEDWAWTGETIPQCQVVGSSTTCTNPSVYPGEASGGTVWGPNTNVSQAFCSSPAANPSARTAPKD